MDIRLDHSGFLNEAQLTALFATLPVGVVVHGPDGCVITANASALEILGLSLAEITGKTSMDPDWQAWQAVREDGTPVLGEQLPAMVCLATGTPVRDVVMRLTLQANREHRWLRIQANPLWVEGELAGVFSCIEDITERRRIEQQLGKTHEQLDLALVGANLGTYDAHLPSGRVDVNERYLAILGYAPGELQMSVDVWMDRINPEDMPRINAHYAQVLASEMKHIDIEYRLRHKDGSWVWLHDRGQVFSVDERGNPVRIAGTQMDITVHKQTEAARQESESRYRTVVESAPDAIIILVDQCVVMANPACVKLFLAKSELEMLGKDIWTLTSPQSHPQIRQRIKHVQQSGRVNPIAEIGIMRLDGTLLLVDGISVSVEYQGRLGVHVMMRDATSRKQAEALMRQHREEMEQALAFQVAHQTVAGIAHELNQPLNAVTTLAEAAQQQIQGINHPPPHLAETLEGLAHAAQRAGRVVRELMLYMRQPSIAHGAVDLGMLVHEAIAQCEASLQFAGEIKLRFPSVLPRVTGNALQIEKIVLNLLQNAVEACRSGFAADGKASIVIDAIDEREFVRIRVSDNGPGIPLEQIPHLFHPFNSKKVGGIGMGLAICYALARSLGGTLGYEPAPGGGACFCLTLPVIKDNLGGIRA